jgi:hypothetical protein
MTTAPEMPPENSVAARESQLDFHWKSMAAICFQITAILALALRWYQHQTFEFIFGVQRFKTALCCE